VFDNTKGLFTPGLYAHVRVQMGQPKARVLVDDRAVGTDLANQFVYVVDAQHKVQYRKVSTGPLFHGLRVIDSGLKPGDEVVVNGLQRVRPGVAVNAEQVAMDYRLDAGDKALVEAAGEQSRQNKRTVQTDQNTRETSVASLSPRERAP
jgi:multidrug efflux pump subunit AcrA (membrane-fusion protein)